MLARPLRLRDLPGLMRTIFFIFLLALPGLALAQASGLEGSILISPVMGGPTRQGAADAKPLPDAEFVVKQGETVVTSFRTDAEGHFSVSLGPGHYAVMKKESGAMGSFGPFEVEVAAGKMKSVQWKCDSGIR